MGNQRTLVAYYSLSGKTKAVAQSLATALRADIEEITPISPHGQGFAGYLRAALAAIFGQAWTVRPTQHAIADYNLVLVGGPIWVGRIAAPVQGWLKANRLPDKCEFAVFATLGGSNCKKAFAEMEALTGKAAIARLEISDRDTAEARAPALMEVFMRALAAGKRPA
jgi:flavodoxin